VGFAAGQSNTEGHAIPLSVPGPGSPIPTGSFNVYVGEAAGQINSTGSKNTFVGEGAGHDTTGSNNVFIGYQAGYHQTGSNRLYIQNSYDIPPLIYGEFDNQRL